MAVVREDVIKISYDVAKPPFAGIAKGIDQSTQEAAKLANSVKGVKEETNKAENSTTKLNDQFKKTTREAESCQKQLKKMWNEWGKTSSTSKAGNSLRGMAQNLSKLAEEDPAMGKLSNTVSKFTNLTLGAGLEGLGSVFDKMKNLKNLPVNTFKGFVSSVPVLAGHIKDLAGNALSKAVSGLKTIAGISFKATIAGVAAVSAGVLAIGKQSLSAYADLQQNVGGVETLFGGAGSEASKIVIQNAQKAYQTAGVSANDYMQNVTSFAASLTSSLGGDYQQAAELANVAMVAMSDNANKMGTDLGSIQNAYQGFAKQNYTMLDNLKLGYGGTKEEMQRLVKDASKMKDVQKDLGLTVDSSSMSFDNIVKAIQVMQTDLGVAGTTAEEASTTISGSIGMLKGAWSNLMAGLADPNADINSLVDDVVNSLKTVGRNVGPVVKQIASTIPQAINSIGQELIADLPGLLAEGGQIISQIGQSIVTALPLLASTGQQILSMIGNAIVANAPQLIPQGATMIMNLLQGLVENLPSMVSGAGQILSALGQGIMNSLPIIKEKGTEIFNTLKSELASVDWGSVGKAIIEGVAHGITGAFGLLGNAVKSVGSAALNTIKKRLGINSPSKVFANQVGRYIPAGMALGITKNAGSVRTAVSLLGKDATITARGSFSARRGTAARSTSMSTTNNRTVSNSYAPNFVLNMNGASATPENERRVRRWIREGIADTFDSLGTEAGYAMG